MEAEDDRLEPKVSKKRQREPLSVEEYNAKALERLLKHSTESTEPPPPGLEKSCRLFNGYKDASGYGRIRYRETVIGAHRASLMIQLNVESLPLENDKHETLQVRHLCNIVNCIEPTHVILGTSAENGEDKIKHGATKGEKHSNAKITEAIARQIKLTCVPKEHPNFETRAQRALRYGTTKAVIKSIEYGQTWAWLPYLDGTTSLDKAKVARETAKKQKKSLSATTMWTEKQWIAAKQKLENPLYVKQSDTRNFNDIYCKEWIRAKHVSGYGMTTIFGVRIRVHALACVIANNYIQPKGLVVRHLCGNAACVEGSHLKFGTTEENMLDKIAHGTNNTKISSEAVEEIRNMYVKGKITQTKIGEMYGLSNNHVSAIISKKSRKHG